MQAVAHACLRHRLIPSYEAEAEGNGKRQGRQRAKFFDDARGSAVECSACLDALVAKRLMNAERIDDGKAVLLRIVGLLAKLVDRFDERQNRLHEDAQTYDDRPRPSSSFSSSKKPNRGRRTSTRTKRRRRVTPVDPAPGVYATLADLVALQYKARGFSFLPRQPIHSLLAGRHASRLRGRGLNFEEIRRYLPGDDIRQIDWKVTARTRKTHSRVYTEERERSVLLVVDQRITMFFGTVRDMKSVAAAETAALAAWRVLAQKDRVGALVFNDSKVVEVRPQRSRSTVMQILHAVLEQNHALSIDPKIESKPGMFNEALRRCERLAKHDCLVCIISDGFGHDQESRQLLTRIAQHNDVLFAFIYDPLETDLPEAGQLVFGDGRRQLEVDTGDRKLRERYRDDFAAERAAGRRFLLQRETPVLPLSTSSGVVEQLQHLLGQSSSSSFSSSSSNDDQVEDDGRARGRGRERQR